jgi:hypothetical protein
VPVQAVPDLLVVHGVHADDQPGVILYLPEGCGTAFPIAEARLPETADSLVRIDFAGDRETHVTFHACDLHRFLILPELIVNEAPHFLAQEAILNTGRRAVDAPVVQFLPFHQRKSGCSVINDPHLFAPVQTTLSRSKAGSIARMRGFTSSQPRCDRMNTGILMPI